MKVLLGILLLISGIVVIIGFMAYIWTFELLYLRIWLTAIVSGLFLLKINKEFGE